MCADARNFRDNRSHGDMTRVLQGRKSFLEKGGVAPWAPLTRDSVCVSADAREPYVHMAPTHPQTTPTQALTTPYGATRKLLSISNRLVQDINRTAPNMKVMKLMLLPSGFCEHVDWGKARDLIWHVIVKENSMLHSHWPK
jgi:hypothetical protein